MCQTIYKYHLSRTKAVQDSVSQNRSVYGYTWSEERASMLTVLAVQDEDTGAYYCLSAFSNQEHVMQLAVLGMFKLREC